MQSDRVVMEETVIGERRPVRGRPRAFEEARALDAALHVFWQKGYEATSLDDLTEAMGISRSSFYGCFGTKHALLIRALEHYAARGIEGLERMRAEAATPQEALHAMLCAVADVEGGPRGCMMSNCISELASHDPEVADIARRHIAAVEDLFEAELRAAGSGPEARSRARTLLSLGLGAVTLRKAGLPPERVKAAIEEARALLPGQAIAEDRRGASWLGGVLGRRKP